MIALCPWLVLPEDAHSYSEATMGKVWGSWTRQKAHYPQEPVKKFSALVVQCFEDLSPGAPLGSGTMRSQNREQRVAAHSHKKCYPTALLCTIYFGPSNAIHWAGQEGMTLGITQLGATCAPRVCLGSSMDGREKELC